MRGGCELSPQDETIRVLQAALAQAPDNVELRLHLADLLRAASRLGEAEEQYRRGLQTQSNHAGLKLGLARAYFEQRKDSHAAVVLDSLLMGKESTAPALVLLARIKLREGDVPAAVAHYQQALDQDPAVEDAALSDHLGVSAEPKQTDSSEVEQGLLRSGGEEEDEDDESFAGSRVERPAINFDDVGGMESIKEEVNIKIIQPLLQPKLFAAYGKPIGGGILLYGPPGCGKTHLARATAGQVEASFLTVGLSDVLDMWVGNSERNLHALFERARSNTPFVLFFDEVDALGASRADLRNNSMRMVINQFLEELDGARESNDGVLILAATNAPWHLDGAFRRPGRFDRILFVPPPDEAARAAILEVLLKGKPTEDVDVRRLAARAEGFSGADLKGMVDLAIEQKLRQVMKTGRPLPLTFKDLHRALKETRPSTKEWFATARNYVLYSNEGGLYDDVAKYLRM